MSTQKKQDRKGSPTRNALQVLLKKNPLSGENLGMCMVSSGSKKGDLEPSQHLILPVRKQTPKSFLTFWCPNSFNTVPSFFVLLWSLWAAMAGLGSLQSMERRWYQRCRPSWMCADLMLGSKRCTSQPLLAMLSSNWLSSLPSLGKKRKKRKKKM